MFLFIGSPSGLPIFMPILSGVLVSDLFLDLLSKTFEEMSPADCKAKEKKIYFHKI